MNGGGTFILGALNSTTAIAWSYVPIVFALPIWIPELLLFGSDNFTKEPRLDAHPVLWIPFIVLTLLELALGVWTLVLACHTIAEVQGFRSAWRGLLNIFLVGMVFVVPLLLLMFILIALTKT